MTYYERVRGDLQQVERTIIMVLRSNISSGVGKRAPEKSLNLVQEAAEKYRSAQAESIQKVSSQGIGME